MSQPGKMSVQQENAHRLFTKLYLVNIPYIQMLTADEISEFGMPRSGDAEFDRQVANEIRTIMIPIPKMAEYYQAGADIRLGRREDAKEIYEIIRDHLLSWKVHIDSSMNQVDAPVEDLILLDRFASRVYEHARFQYTLGTEYVSSLLNRMSGSRATMVSTMLANMGRRGVQVAPAGHKFDTAANIVPETPGYRSMSRDFAPALQRTSESLNTHGQQQPSQTAGTGLGTLGRAIGDMLARNQGGG